VRDAAGRDVNIERLRPLLERIDRNAGMSESDDLGHVLAAEDGASERESTDVQAGSPPDG
jgi:hypothetical protein